MRYIDTSGLGIPADWLDMARANHFSPLWSYLKPQFESLIGKKCWYNESINDGSSNPIDHFRPKSKRVRKLESKYASLEAEIWNQLTLSDTQNGYPFLEFQVSNYRYACGFANSTHVRESLDGITRGKWDFFPIRFGGTVGTSLAELGTEEFALLDPCNPLDPELITFNQLGKIEPSEGVLTASWEYCRVKVSVEVYHLNYYVILDKRNLTWEKCERDVELLTILYNTRQKTQAEQLSFDHLFAQLVNSMSKKSEYSAVVIDCIKFFKKRKDRITYAWLNIFSDVLLKK